MKTSVTKLPVLLILLIGSCTSAPPALIETHTPINTSIPNPTQIQVLTRLPIHTPTQEDIPMPQPIIADVLTVKATGVENAYQFNVEVSSPDTGCDQYADWWEVLSEDGQLLYRRVLLHSHVNEQPFTRSGGTVPIGSNTIVIVRAHMNNGGYGGRALKGSAASGFEVVELESGFAADVEALPPLPEDCAF